MRHSQAAQPDQRVDVARVFFSSVTHICLIVKRVRHRPPPGNTFGEDTAMLRAYLVKSLNVVIAIQSLIQPLLVGSRGENIAAQLHQAPDMQFSWHRVVTYVQGNDMSSSFMPSHNTYDNLSQMKCFLSLIVSQYKTLTWNRGNKRAIPHQSTPSFCNPHQLNIAKTNAAF